MKIKRFILNHWKVGSIIIGMIILEVIIVNIFIPKDAKITVTGIGWKYVINIEKLKTFTESTWYSVPVDGRFLFSQREIREYRTVKIGDVSYNQPVYDRKLYYEIDRYVHERELVTEGNNRLPYFANLTLEDNEREEDREEIYYIYGTRSNSNEIETFTIDKMNWYNINIGDTIDCEVSFSNHLTIK